MDENKRLVLMDDINILDCKDEFGKNKNLIIMKDQYTGEVIFKGNNKAILPSAAFTAANAFKLPIVNRNPSYNTALGLENSKFLSPQEKLLKERVVLFGVGTDGCGPDKHQVFNQNYSQWCSPQDIVPFRVQELDYDIDKSMRERYFGRAIKNNRIYYYFKGFDTAPVFEQVYESDNTPVDENVYESHRVNEEISSYMLLKMSIDEEDCKQFFKNTVGIKHAVVNTIFLVFAVPQVIDDYIYFQEIRPYTKFNFPNEHLMHLKKGIDIFYYVFY